MKTKIILLLLAFEVVAQFGCEVSNPCGPFASQFHVLGYAAFFTVPRFGAPPLDTSVVYRYDSIAVRLQPTVEYLLAEQLRAGFSRALFSSAAVACSPAIPYSIDTLSTVVVTTDFKYDSIYHAADTVNGIFLIDFLDDHRNERHSSLDQFVNQQPSAKSDAFLRLNTPPPSQERVRFTIYIKHRNGAEFILKTATITIKP